MTFLETVANAVIQLFNVCGNKGFWNAVSTFFHSGYKIIFAPYVFRFTGKRDDFVVWENDSDRHAWESVRKMLESFLSP